MYTYTHVKEITSTNKVLSEKGRLNEPAHVVLRADRQTDGVGRLGRKWVSEEQTGLYLSILERPDIDTNMVPLLSLLMGLDVCKAMEEMFNVKTSLKWPNDVVLDSKKLAGILATMELKDNKADFAVIGVGINLFNAGFPDEIKETAISLYLHDKAMLGNDLDVDGKEKILKKLEKTIVKYWESDYNKFLEEKSFISFVNEYESLLANKGKRVRVLDPNGEYEGTAVGITDMGGLIVELDDGTKRIVVSGEVSVRGIYGYI